MAQDNQAGSQGQAAEVERLLAILRDKELREKEPKLVVEAIQKLGRLRAVAAIDDLVSLLTFSRRYDWERERPGYILRIHPITPGDRYPAAGALLQIGKPALLALVHVIADKEIDSLEFQNASYTVMNIFPGDLPAGAKYLRGEATKASSPVAQQRLLAAAQWIDDLQAKLKAIEEADKTPK